MSHLDRLLTLAADHPDRTDDVLLPLFQRIVLDGDVNNVSQMGPEARLLKLCESFRQAGNQLRVGLLSLHYEGLLEALHLDSTPGPGREEAIRRLIAAWECTDPVARSLCLVLFVHLAPIVSSFPELWYRVAQSLSSVHSMEWRSGCQAVTAFCQSLVGSARHATFVECVLDAILFRLNQHDCALESASLLTVLDTLDAGSASISYHTLSDQNARDRLLSKHPEILKM